MRDGERERVDDQDTDGRSEAVDERETLNVALRELLLVRVVVREADAVIVLDGVGDRVRVLELVMEEETVILGETDGEAVAVRVGVVLGLSTQT